MLSIILLDYIFNSCFALTGIFRVMVILEAVVGSSFARELILVKFFSSDFGEQDHTFGFLGRLDSGQIAHFLVQQRVIPIIFVYILIRWGGG